MWLIFGCSSSVVFRVHQLLAPALGINQTNSSAHLFAYSKDFVCDWHSFIQLRLLGDFVIPDIWLGSL